MYPLKLFIAVVVAIIQLMVIAAAQNSKSKPREPIGPPGGLPGKMAPHDSSMPRASSRARAGPHSRARARKHRPKPATSVTPKRREPSAPK